MKVSLSPSFHQNNKINNLNKSQYLGNCTQRSSKSNISFGAEGSLIYIVARAGLDAIKNGPKHYNTVKFLQEVEDVLNNPSLNGQHLANTLSALSKTPDNISESRGYNLIATLMGKGDLLDLILPTSVQSPDLDVATLRHSAIGLLSKTKDDSYVNIQSKKDFIQSLFSHGYGIQRKFVDEFSKLNDAHYKSFKQEIIDKALYSKEYLQKNTAGDFHQGTDERYRCNLALIETLNPSEHSEYLAKINPTIVEMKQGIFNELLKAQYHRERKFYPLHTNFIRSENKFHAPISPYISLGEIDKHAKDLWDGITKTYKYDKSKISKAINMEENIVEDMLADTKACNTISQPNTSKEEKIRIAINRINEKFNNSDVRIIVTAIDWINSAMKSGVNMKEYNNKYKSLFESGGKYYWENPAHAEFHHRDNEIYDNQAQKLITYLPEFYSGLF